MGQTECLFFLSGRKHMTTKEVRKIFRNGLVTNINSICETLMYVDANDRNIEYKVKDYGYDMIFVIRIPKLYYNPEVDDGGLKQIPLPLWKKDNDCEFYLSNNLIYGVYDSVEGTFMYNDNYNQLHDPIGLIFDQHQEKYFSDYNLKLWVRFSKFRRKYNYESLVKIDLNKEIWSDSLRQYKKYFYGFNTEKKNKNRTV